MTENNNTSQNNTSQSNNTSPDPTPISQLEKRYLDIQGILEKIKNLPIDDKDKATILEQFKDNILNPAKGENRSLDQIQAKYTAMENPQPQSPMDFLPPVNAHYPYGYYRQQHQQGNQMPNQMPNQGNQMTTAHFEILKNKIDSLQLELVDLLRHVKDYTQRYMNSVRQQDLDKINDYINGLFQVDKTLKETKEKSEEVPVDEEPVPEDTKEGIISKTTNGIKNFLGGIGNNVSGITNLVSNTANIANTYLSKKILSTSNASTSNVSTSSNTNTNTSRNKNIVSVDEYISNMNKLEEPNNTGSTTNTTTTKPETVPIPNSNIVSSNANNFNLNNNINNKDKGANAKETPVVEEDLDSALETLNNEMNKDIDNTVNPPVSQAGGYSHKDKLTKKISLLRLKLTKKRLQKQLKEENRHKHITNNINNNKTKHNNSRLINKNKNIKKSKINKK
jgi:hypothetical protein